MSKKVEAIISDKTIIVLAEDANKGDYIDLANLTNVDLSNLEKQVADAKDTIYQKKLSEAIAKETKIKEAEFKALSEEALRKQEALYNKDLQDKLEEINGLKAKLEGISKEAKLSYQEELLGINEKHQEALRKQEALYNKELQGKLEEINGLKAQLEGISKEAKLSYQEELLNINEKHQKSLREQEAKFNQAQAKLQAEIAELKMRLESASSDAKLAYQDELIKLQKDFYDALEAEKAKYEQLNNDYLLLRNQKAATNNKMIGENLETFCDAAAREAMQAGMLNCTWEKDTKAVKGEGEEKGTKADYLFKIYLNEEHRPEELLTSVSLEMKDENPDSKDPKTNEDHYKKLDSDRTKKGAKYAILVSNLEFKNSNIPPIYRVVEYPDMYVVRPAYMVTFLSLIVSLTMRFQDLIISSINSEISLKKQTEFLDQFESLKNTYLDKPLDSLTKKVNEIMEQTEKARVSINNVDKLCVEIINQYIGVIESKLNNFDAKMKTNYRKLDK